MRGTVFAFFLAMLFSCKTNYLSCGLCICVQTCSEWIGGHLLFWRGRCQWRGLPCCLQLFSHTGVPSSFLLSQQRLRYLDPCAWTVQRWRNCCQRACLWNGNHQVSFLVLRSNFNSFFTLQYRISSKLIPNWVWLISLSLLGWMVTIFWLCIMPQRRLANWQYLRTGLCWLRPWPTGLTSKHLKSRSKLRVRQVFSECMNSFVGRKIY